MRAREEEKNKRGGGEGKGEIERKEISSRNSETR